MTTGRKTCDVCDRDMTQIKSWFWSCPHCRFAASSLASGAGADIGGLDELRRQNFATILDRLEQIKPVASATFLEVGCAKGLFLDAVQQRGGSIRGLEPDRPNAEIARQTGVPVKIGYFPRDVEAGEQYDVIIFNDVFEHIPAPHRIAEALPALLNPGGLAIINLPNSDGFIYRLSMIANRLGVSDPLERLWQKGLQSPHISYFNADNLKRLVERYSELRQIDTFTLRTIRRQGLYARIRSTFPAIAAVPICAGVWVLSFLEPLLPADITVAVFQKDDETT